MGSAAPRTHCDRLKTYQDQPGSIYAERADRLNADAAANGTIGEAATSWLRSVGISHTEDVGKFHSYEAAAEVYDEHTMGRFTALGNDFQFAVDAKGRWVAGTGSNPHVHAEAQYLSVFIASPALRTARPGAKVAKVDPDFLIKVVWDDVLSAWVTVKFTVKRIKAKSLVANRKVIASVLGDSAGRPLGATESPAGHQWLTAESVGLVEHAPNVYVGGDEAVGYAMRWRSELAADFFEQESAEFAGFTGTGNFAGPRNGFSQEAPFSPDRIAWLGGDSGEVAFLNVIEDIDRGMAREHAIEEALAEEEGWGVMGDDAFLAWADAEAERLG